MSDRYHRLVELLVATGRGTMMCRGNSMRPVLPNPSHCTYERRDTYEVGDIVFCRVRGRFIDAHRITRVGRDGRYMIANNHGHENGWTRTIFGRVIEAKDSQDRVCYRREG